MTTDTYVEIMHFVMAIAFLIQIYILIKQFKGKFNLEQYATFYSIFCIAMQIVFMVFSATR